MNIKRSIRNLFSFNQPTVNNNEAPANWHEDFIVHLASIVQPKVYVELGLYQSVLFNRIIPYAEQLIGIEKDPTLEKYMQINPKTQFICTTTDEYAKQLKKHPIQIDMLFIDANHNAKSVEKDFKQFFPSISPHGLILLHDSHPKNEYYTQDGYCSDAYKTIEKLSHKTKEYEMMTIPIHPGLTICRKRRKQLKWEEVRK